MSRLRRGLAHLITCARAVAAPLLALALWHDYAATAFAVVIAAGLSDVVDGLVARGLAVASEAGRWFDHLADIVLLLAGFATLAVMGEVPWIVPLSIAGAFGFYVADSLWRSEARSLVASRLGHFSGVLNYAVLGIVVLDLAAMGGFVPGWLRSLAVGSVPWYSAAAVASRIAAPRADPVH